MISLATVLLAGAALAVAVWAALALHVLAIQKRRDRTRAVLAAAIQAIQAPDTQSLSNAERAARLRRLLVGSSRELIMQAAADRDTPEDAFHPLASHLIEHWGIETLLADAAGHRSSRDKWRRIAALRILSRMAQPESLDLLARAVEEPDEDVGECAIALLGASTDLRAMDLLLDALAGTRHQASRIAAHIEQSGLRIADRLKTRLGDANPVVRLWSATLLARYPEERIEADLAALTDDPDPRVRKAAIQTLGVVGDALAADCALRLLTDPLAYVRAHAARALGVLGRDDLAAEVARLLGDGDWWTRLAARESLEMMGSEVWPLMMRCLDDDDRFVRNGAAEVIQNLGVLDSLIVMEAATDRPAQSKIILLRRIAAAGGVRFTDSLVDRADPVVGQRIRQLLSHIGLARVGAC